jgi:hypothetical protein
MLEIRKVSPRHAPAHHPIAIACADSLPHPGRPARSFVLDFASVLRFVEGVRPLSRKLMRISALIVLLPAFAAPAQAQSVHVTGRLGYLSEWELAATVNEYASAGKKEFSGPLVLRHVGLCTPGRPVEMSGEIRYQITGWTTSRMKATLWIEGTECGFAAKLSEAYEGVMSCQQWRGVPLSLSVKTVD